MAYDRTNNCYKKLYDNMLTTYDNQAELKRTSKGLLC